MNAEHLKLFVRVAALNNISQAGGEMGLSPAVSSAHISKLEESLGTRLIHRTTRKVSLTEDGEAFLPHAQAVLESIEVAQASVGSGSTVPKGKLRVTAPASFGRLHVIPYLEDFLNQYSDLQIDLHLSDTISDLIEGGFDIAIRDASMTDSTLIARKLAPVRRILCASPKYLKKYGHPKSPRELKEHKIVNFMGLEKWTFETKKGQESVKTKSILRTDNGEAARDAAINGLGITMCSNWVCYDQLKSKELVQVLKNFPLKSSTSIWAVYPSSRMLSLKVRVFIDYLSTVYAGLPCWK